MRALNLNSPAPFAQHGAHPGEGAANNGSGSPDLSPSSTTSTLLTPSDLSPPKHPFELKLNAAYEMLSAPAAVNGSSVPSSSLLLDHTSPVKTRDYMLPSTHSFHTRFPPAQMPFSLPSGSLSYLDAYADSASPLLANQPLGDAALMRSLQAQTMAWRQHQLYSPSDWLLEGDQNGFGLSGLTADLEAPRASPPQISVPARQGSTAPHAHEVRS